MKPIKESATHYGDGSDDYYSSGKENNDMNYSQNLEHSFKTMTMSQKDPNRAPMIIPDLCQFLKDEYKNKLGVHTNNSKDLL
jgi:hypothetical protein